MAKARGLLVWSISLLVVGVLLIPGLFLAWVMSRAEEGTLPLPGFLKPSSVHTDPVPPDLAGPRPGIEERVIARVLDSTGAPRPGIPVLLCFARSTGQGPEEWTLSARSNETGWVTFSNLPTRFTGGFVEATPARGWPIRKEFSFEGTWPCRVEVVVPDGGGLKVLVSDESGAALDGVEVRAVLHRRLEEGEPRYGRETGERNGWRRRTKEVLRDPDGVERWIDCWTSVSVEGAEEGIVISGRPAGGGQFDFPRVHPGAAVLVMAWAKGRAVTSARGPRVVNAGEDATVALTLPRSAELRGPVVELPDATPASNRTVRLLPMGVPSWLNTGMPSWRTDERGKLSGPAIDLDREYAVVIEAPDAFDGVTRYLDVSGSWRPRTGEPIKLERDVPIKFRSSTPRSVEPR